MQPVSGGSWFTIGDQCRLRATATGSDEGHLIFGEPPHQHELTFTAAALRNFVTTGATMLARIEAMAAE
jgi:type IV secretory pathway protease TraF